MMSGRWRSGSARATGLAAELAVCVALAALAWAAGEKGGGPEHRSMGENRILEVLEDIHANQSRGMMNVPPDDGRLLRVLVEAVDARHVVEIGTSNGYSGLWICLALQRTGGRLTTHEIDAGRAKLARENFRRAGVESMVTLVEGDAHQEVLRIREPIDVLFIDADKAGYIDYLRKLLPMVRPGGLILAHNTTSSAAEVADYVKAVTTDPDLETVFWTSNDRGLGVTLKKRVTPQTGPT